MTKDEQQQLEALKAKKSLIGAERAQMKALERKFKRAQKEAATKKSNVFATKPTTAITPLPIRFSLAERTGITELANDIKRESQLLIINELGSEREINETKLIRAAIYLLKEHSHEEIIDAIKQVKLNMIR